MSDNAFNSFTLLRRAMVLETAKNMTIAAIAIKRYELQHQQLPPTLENLTPAFLKTTPLDYMNGQALHYRKNQDGTFLLYSVGLNGVDDGGKPSSHKWWELYWVANDFDSVWPQPATADKIQNYYEHPPNNLPFKFAPIRVIASPMFSAITSAHVETPFPAAARLVSARARNRRLSGSSAC